ncbi:MAG: class I SAM-dependent methyltransferase [Actinomycetia bacterium]|nr:class I SAM-dependent methyltransferase [Actinomycetes bacterium]
MAIEGNTTRREAGPVRVTVPPGGSWWSEPGDDPPGTRGRHRLVWRLVTETLRAMTPAGRRPLVLDCGGGSGSYAVPLARAGAEVTLIDISADALATLRRRAAEAGVADRVRAVQGDVEALTEFVPTGAFDLALLHGVLDVVDDPGLALRQVAAALRPDGRVSVLVANPVASVLTRAFAGDARAARDELRALLAGGPSQPGGDLARLGDGCLGPAVLDPLFGAAGLAIERFHGVGGFTELVPGAQLDAQPDALAALEELEALAAGVSPFREIAPWLHVLATRARAG